MLAEWICDHDLDCKDGSDEKVALAPPREIQETANGDSRSCFFTENLEKHKNREAS